MSDQNQWAAEPPTQPAPQFHPKSPPPPAQPGQRQDTPPAPQQPAQPQPPAQPPAEQWGQQGGGQQAGGQQGADPQWQHAATQNWSPQQTPSPGQQTPQAPGGGQQAPQTPGGGQQWTPQPYNQQQPYQPYQQQPGAGGWSPTPPQQLPQSGKPPRRRRKMRRSVMALFTVIVLVVLLVIGDRVARAIAENEFASQAQSAGLPVKPGVDIEGFPFLTQLIGKDFNKVDITANNIPAGPVTITSVKATITGLHISSFSASAKAHADHVAATAFLSFGNLLSATGLGDIAQITAKPEGNNKIKLTTSLGGVFTDTEEAQILQTGPQTIEVKLLGGGDLGSLAGGQSFSFTLPKGVPASLRITGLNVDSQGLTVSLAASNVDLQKS
jgi:hypothetical protein